MIKMIAVFVVVFAIVGVAQLVWATLNKDDRKIMFRVMLKSGIIAVITTAILSVIIYLF